MDKYFPLKSILILIAEAILGWDSAFLHTLFFGTSKGNGYNLTSPVEEFNSLQTVSS